MDRPIKITNIPTREKADSLARILAGEKPGWKVAVIEQPGGKFTVLATPPTGTRDGGTSKPERLDADRVTHAKATVGHVKPLLDLIAKAESGGNYDAHFSEAGNTNPRFTQMSVDEVLAWQKGFVRSGKPSSAVGRYQIIRGTLKGLKTNMKLKGAETFDAVLQDKMALELLKGRGLEAYLLGRVTMDAFIDEIAKEWAGLPNTSGKSHYDGDGLNAARIKLVKLKPVIKLLR